MRASSLSCWRHCSLGLQPQVMLRHPKGAFVASEQSRMGIDEAALAAVMSLRTSGSELHYP